MALKARRQFLNAVEDEDEKACQEWLNSDAAQFLNVACLALALHRKLAETVVEAGIQVLASQPRHALGDLHKDATGDGETLLLVAARSHCTRVFRHLLALVEPAAAVQYVSDKDETLFYAACSAGQAENMAAIVDVARALGPDCLRSVVSPAGPTRSNWLPIHALAMLTEPAAAQACLDLFFEAATAVDMAATCAVAVGGPNRTPLIVAAAFGTSRSVATICSHVGPAQLHAALSHVDCDGRCALWYAMGHGCMDSTRILLEHWQAAADGALPRLSILQGRLSLVVAAVANNRSDVVRMLRTREVPGFVVAPAFEWANECECTAVDRLGHTPLALARHLEHRALSDMARMEAAALFNQQRREKYEQEARERRLVVAELVAWRRARVRHAFVVSFARRGTT